MFARAPFSRLAHIRDSREFLRVKSAQEVVSRDYTAHVNISACELDVGRSCFYSIGLFTISYHLYSRVT